MIIVVMSVGSTLIGNTSSYRTHDQQEDIGYYGRYGQKHPTCGFKKTAWELLKVLSTWMNYFALHLVKCSPTN